MSEFDKSPSPQSAARIVTLTSDLGADSLYLASIKGALVSRDPSIHVIDISHAIRPFDFRQAAFALRNTAGAFPPGTVHILALNTMPTGEDVHRVMQLGGQFFVGTDDGIFGMIAEKEPEAVYDITVQSESDSLTFPSLNVFVQVACHLISGGVPAVIGRRTDRISTPVLQSLTSGEDWLQGVVQYVDGYGNLITNIDEKFFNKVAKGRPFCIPLRTLRTKVSHIKKTYNEVAVGDRVVLFNHMGLLEIAINKGGPSSGGGASQLLGLKVDSILRLEFTSE